MSFQNLSFLDRTIRILIGLVMFWAGWNASADTEIWPIALRIFAWLPLLTGLLGWCPVYAMLGLSTRKLKAPPRDP